MAEFKEVLIQNRTADFTVMELHPFEKQGSRV
jgi:hypothetical protein